MADDKVLTDAEKLALEEEEKQKKENEAFAEKLKNLSPEQIEDIVKGKFGVGSAELIKKEEQIKVLTDAEKKELEEKESGDALIVAIDQGWIKKKDYDSYLELKASDKVSIARKKFIERSSDTPEEAGKVFDKIIKIEEPDEIEDPKDAEKKIPNKEKQAAKAWAESIAEEAIDAQYGKTVKSLPERHKAFLAQEKVKKDNAVIISKAITEIPKRLEIEVEDGVKYGIDLSDEDITAAHNMVVKEVLTKADLKAEEVKENASLFLFAKNVKRIVSEAATISYKKGVEDTERGAKGIVDKDKPDLNTDAKTAFAKKHGLIP